MEVLYNIESKFQDNLNILPVKSLNTEHGLPWEVASRDVTLQREFVKLEGLD